MKENILPPSNSFSEKQRTQNLKQKIYEEGIKLLGDSKIQFLSSSDSKYIQMLILGKEFFEEHGVEGIDLAVCGTLNDCNVVGEGEREVLAFEKIELYTLHEGYGVIMNYHSPEKEDMHRLTEEELEKLLKTVKNSRVIEHEAKKDHAIMLPILANRF